MGESIAAKNVYRGFVVSILHKESLLDLIGLDIVDL